MKLPGPYDSEYTTAEIAASTPKAPGGGGNSKS